MIYLTVSIQQILMLIGYLSIPLIATFIIVYNVKRIKRENKKRAEQQQLIEEQRHQEIINALHNKN